MGRKYLKCGIYCGFSWGYVCYTLMLWLFLKISWKTNLAIFACCSSTLIFSGFSISNMDTTIKVQVDNECIGKTGMSHGISLYHEDWDVCLAHFLGMVCLVCVLLV